MQSTFVISNNMTNRFTISLDLYNCRITVILTDDSINKIYKRLQKKYSEQYIIEEIEPMGMAFSPDNDTSIYYIILNFTNNQIDIWAFVHEIDHIKNYILKYRGVHYNRINDESGAYLSGYIADCIYKIMKKKEIIFK